MSNDPIYHFLLFVLRQTVHEAGSMKLRFTALVALASVEYLIDVNCLVAATIFIGATGAEAYFSLWGYFVKPTVAHFSYWEKLLAAVATYQVQI